MLDTKGRRFVQPIFESIAKFCVVNNISATKITFFALILGIISAILLVFNYNISAIIVLWISGLFDAVDGTVARVSNSTSKLGGFLDVVFDRVVEVSILLAIGYLNNQLYMVICFVLSAIILSMTIFLTSGGLIVNQGNKMFHYQSGLAERTEGFVMLSLAMLFFSYAHYFLIIFAIIIMITATQRFYQTCTYLKEG